MWGERAEWRGVGVVKASSCPAGVISPKCVCLCPWKPPCGDGASSAEGLKMLCAGFFVTIYMTACRMHWVYGWPRVWNVLDVDGRAVWNLPLPSTRVGVSELQPVSPRKCKTVCVCQTIVPKRSCQFPYNFLTFELLLKHCALEGGWGRGVSWDSPKPLGGGRGGEGRRGELQAAWCDAAAAGLSSSWVTSGFLRARHFLSRKGRCAVCYLRH